MSKTKANKALTTAVAETATLPGDTGHTPIPDAQHSSPEFDASHAASATATLAASAQTSVKDMLNIVDTDMSHTREVLQKAAALSDQKLASNTAERQELELQRTRISNLLETLGEKQRVSLNAPASITAPARRMGRPKGSKNTVKAKTNGRVKSATIGKVDKRSKGGLNRSAVVREVVLGMKGWHSAGDIFTEVQKANSKIKRQDMNMGLQAMRKRGELKVRGEVRKYEYNKA